MTRGKKGFGGQLEIGGTRMSLQVFRRCWVVVLVADDSGPLRAHFGVGDAGLRNDCRPAFRSPPTEPAEHQRANCGSDSQNMRSGIEIRNTRNQASKQVNGGLTHVREVRISIMSREPHMLGISKILQRSSSATQAYRQRQGSNYLA